MDICSGVLRNSDNTTSANSSNWKKKKEIKNLSQILKPITQLNQYRISLVIKQTFLKQPLVSIPIMYQFMYIYCKNIEDKKDTPACTCISCILNLDMYLTWMGTGHNAKDSRVFIHVVHGHTAKHPVVSVNE